MTLIGNLFKGVLAIAMIVAVVAAGAIIFTTVGPMVGGLAQLGATGGSSATTTSSKQPVVFEIKPGESVSQIGQNLQSAGLIGSGLLDGPVAFKVKCGDCNLKAGRFQLTPGMSMDDLIKTLSTPPAELGLRFQVIEGKRIEEMAEQLGSQGVVSPTHFIQLALTPQGSATYQDAFISASGKPADQGLEGFLFPNTYEIKQNGSDNSDGVIRKMLGTMEERVTQQMLDDLKAKGHTFYQALIIASIVQREGVVSEELPTIAAVYWNRIDRGMQLDADPTTQYAVGKPGAWWPNLDTIGVNPNDVDNPYNTYRIQGLPPGPICNPGFDAINAAIYPAQNNYLYFVAKNDGTGRHAFAETLDEQERNRVIYGNRQP